MKVWARDNGYGRELERDADHSPSSTAQQALATKMKTAASALLTDYS